MITANDSYLVCVPMNGKGSGFIHRGLAHAVRIAAIVTNRAPTICAGRTRFTSPEDAMILEDEQARITLCGDALPVDQTVTGACARTKRGCHGAIEPAPRGERVQVVWFCLAPL